MATFNTAFGTLPSPATQLFGGNAGGGVAGAPPVEPKTQTQRSQKGMAPGTTPTFAQLQQQGQARPAPAAGMAPAAALAPQQPPMLSALNTQLNQPAPQQPAQQPAAQRQFTPQELTAARERFKSLQDTGIANINTAAAQWGQGVKDSPINVGGSISNFLEQTRGGGSSMGGGGIATGGSYGASYDENGLPTATWTPLGGVAQTIRQDFPEDLDREALAAAQAEDDAAAAAQPQQAQMASSGEMAPAEYSTAQQLPAYQSSGAFGGSSQAQALRSRLEQQLNDLSQNEAQIQGQSYAALRKAKMDEMGAEFGAQRSQLEEDLARRGLAASTIGGGRYGDLAGQQARATASFEADLLKQQAEAEAENRKVYLSGMSELAGMAGQQDLGAFEANLKSRQADADISLRTQELQQKAALEGRSLNLQEARDLATKEYQGGQLQQGYAEISSRERMSASDIASRQQMQQSQFGFDREQSALERSLRETMQTRQLTSEEKRQLDQLTEDKRRNLAGESQAAAELAERKRSGQEGEKIQREQLGEDKRRNEALEKVQTGELTLRQGTAVSQLISDIYGGRVPAESWEAALRAMGLDPTKFVGLKPAAKEKEKEKEPEKEKEKEKDKPGDPDKADKGVGTGDGRNAEGNTSYTSQPINLNTIPNNLNNYSVGQTFNYQGVLLTLRADNMLYDSNGKRFMTGE